MRKIGIKLQDRAGRSEADRCPRGSNTTHEGRIELAGLQWLPPPRQLPFRWKCDGCPLFRMIKYRRKNGVPRPKPGARPWYSATTQTVLPKTCALCLLFFSSPSSFPLPFFRQTVRPLTLPLSKRLSIVNGRKTGGRNVILMQYLFIYK